MSQLSTFSKQVDASHAAIEKLLSETVDLSNDTAVASRYVSLKKLLSQLENDLLPTSEKLRQKLGQVDPVTGAKRYGAQAEQKFVTSATLLDNSTVLLRSHIQDHEDRYLSAKLSVDENAIRQEKAKSEALPLPEMSKFTVERFGVTSIDEGIDGNSSVALENEELHSKAEELRVKKQQEMDELRDLEKRLDSFLRTSYAEMLNNEFLLSDVATVVHAIRTSANFVSSDWKLMKTFLLDILRRIVSKPDDVNLRKLRVTHPTIQSKLTGKTGGIPLLLAVGFRVVLKKEIPEQPPSTGAADSAAEPLRDDLSHHPHRVQWLKQNRPEWEASFLAESSSIWTFPSHSPVTTSENILRDYTQVFPLCTNPSLSPWELFLEMEEPPIDDLLAAPAPTSTSISTEEHPTKKVRVQLTWIDWYDRLQASISILEQA